MKTYKNLFAQISSFENLYKAYRRARRGKRDREVVAAFEFNLESNLLHLQEQLREHTYQPGSYHSFYIHDPKRRLISAAPLSLCLAAGCRAVFPSVNHTILEAILGKTLADEQVIALCR